LSAQAKKQKSTSKPTGPAEDMSNNLNPNPEKPHPCAPMVCPSLMQTHAQGPWQPGDIGPLSKEDLEKCTRELAEVKQKTGWQEPNRGDTFNDPTIVWRFGGPPNYTLANLEYFKYKSKHHAQGSLEEIVENLVKTWEFERSHKLLPEQHTVANHEGFALSANGGKKYGHLEAAEKGNYNALLDSCDSALWDNDKIDNRKSHDIFHAAFPAFAWEILKVYTGPPQVHFEWRHFGRFTGVYEGHQGNGELIDVRGHGIAMVNNKLQLLDTQIFYNQEQFLRAMRGEIPATELCPPGVTRAIDDPKNYGKPETSLFARIGKGAAVGVAVELFYHKILNDAALAPAFAGKNMAQQKAHLGAFLTMAFGGPSSYTGKNMRDAHKHSLAGGFPTEEVFGMVAGHLVATLKDLRIPEKETNEIVTIALSVKDDVLGK